MRRSFDRLARAYQPLERLLFGGLLQRTRTAHLNHLQAARRVLVVGEGDGRFVERLLRSNRTCDVVVLDASRGMIERARSRVGGNPRVRFCCDDARTHAFADQAPFDALVTPFFLDCFEGDELRQVVSRLTRQAEPGACWVIADFCLSERRSSSWWRRCWWQRCGLWLLYRAFAALTDIRARRLCDPLPLLAELGWQLHAEQRFAAGWLRSCVLQRSDAEAQSALPAASQT